VAGGRPGGFGNGVRGRIGGGRSDGDIDGGGFDSPGLMVRARLYSRQHVGHRHSTISAPSGFLYRVRRQPNCALMRV
jgi:hypothetical protein